MTTDLIARLRQKADATRRALLQERTNLYDEAADELERLTPTEEEKKSARYLAKYYEDKGATRAAALLRKYVLREKT